MAYYAQADYSQVPAVGIDIDQVDWSRYTGNCALPSRYTGSYESMDEDEYADDVSVDNAAEDLGYQTHWFNQLKAQDLADREQLRQASLRAYTHSAPPSEQASYLYSTPAEAEDGYIHGYSPNSVDAVEYARTDDDEPMSDALTFNGNSYYSSPSSARPLTPLPAIEEEPYSPPMSPCSPFVCRHPDFPTQSYGLQHGCYKCIEEYDPWKDYSFDISDVQGTTESSSSCSGVAQHNQDHVDARKNQNEFQRLTERIESTEPDPNEGVEAETIEGELSRRRILKAKSQKAKAIRKIAASAKDFIEAFATIGQPGSKQATRISKTPSVEIIKVVKKRPARDSFIDKPAQPVIIDDDIQYIGTKRARIAVDTTVEDVEVESDAVPANNGADNDAEDADDDPNNLPPSRVVSGDFFQHKPLPTPPKGYPGQFEGMFVDNDNKAVFASEPHNPFPVSTHAREFGSVVHPNGTFTHTAFEACPLIYQPDFTTSNCSTRDPIVACMKWADDMTVAAARPRTVRMRTHDEEILRREAHLECASSRLEGVGVGYWRYYQGLYSIGEYKEAGLCICWDQCKCSKMCTRYGDMRCPCGKAVIVRGDDD